MNIPRKNIHFELKQKALFITLWQFLCGLPSKHVPVKS